jgi:hypothetical protein
MNMQNLAKAKKKLKSVKILYVPYRLLRRIFNEILFVLHIIGTRKVNIFKRNKFRIAHIPKQKVTEIELGAMPAFENFSELINWLKAKNIEFYEGGHTIYLPPQEQLKDLFYPLFSLYPQDAGLKILKDFKGANESRYVTKEVKPNHLTSYCYVMSRPFELLRIANYLFLAALGAKIYDLIQIKAGLKLYTAYVIQHITGQEPNADDWTIFLDNLRTEFRKRIIMPKNRDWLKHNDFCPPASYRNAIRSEKDNKLYYVDFQAFIFRNENKYLTNLTDRIREIVHFGKKHWIRGSKYLYQSILNDNNGKRDTTFRWLWLKKLMQENRIDMSGKVVFDIGCNAGMMLHCALAEGAFWGLGWDKDDIAKSADSLLSALGDTRYNLFGGNISQVTDFYSYIPHHLRNKKDGILLLLAMRKHIGFPEYIKHLPVKYIIYEGHQDESVKEAQAFLKQACSIFNCRVLQIDEYQDGDSLARPLAILAKY